MAAQTTYTSNELGPGGDAAFEEGLRIVRAGGDEHRLLVGGRWREGSGTSEERSPACLSEVLGTFATASAADVAFAVETARAARRDWARRPIAERIAYLAAAADALHRRAGELAATLTLEVGKNRLESMGEVDEAIELIRFYSSQAADGFDIPLAGATPPGSNVSTMRPFGTFGVIAPFNFPLALVLGPAVAAMLGGNTVVAKPAPTTSATGVLVAEVLCEAGLPDGVFNLVTGGDPAGRALVDARLDGIVFTGSRAVGRRIAGRFLARADAIRPCILEMGGKNPAIVTARADLETAAAGIARSAWGLSGQKCSACSRVLVAEAVHDALVALLVEHARRWRPSDPTERGCRLGPVHTAAAQDRFRRAVADARADGHVAAGGGVPRDGRLADGYYVEPTVVTDLPPRHHLVREEQFVPLLAVERVGSLGEALARANEQLYGLTAGMFSEDADEIRAFLEGIEAGTLFVNRAAGATSGGWPGRQTYPGWKGSGSTHRGALGPRYVQQFLREQGRTIVA